MIEIPLGKCEGQKLEFKSRDALASPDAIAREVVAMLNAKGGDIWIGIEESGGRAVEVRGVEEPEKAVRSLTDLLIDTIEPSPQDDEVRVEYLEGSGGVLRVEVKPKGNNPYAHKRRSAWTFVIRVSDRIRHMSREEIARQLTDAGRNDSRNDGLARLKRRMQERSSGFFCVGLELMGTFEIDIQDRRLEGLLSDPGASNNRRGGWNFLFPSAPIPRMDRIELGDDGFRSTRIYKDGGVYFGARLESLVHGGEPGEIWPLALIEFPVSVVRLAGALYGLFVDSDSSLRVSADIAFWDIGGWKLRPHSPAAVGYRVLGPQTFEDKDLVWDRPLQFGLSEIVHEPDRCGHRLIRRTYEAFGYREDSIPDVFDPETGRLML